ncbi:phenylacetate--CoA ligase family protein [Haloarchaeobius sp. TZWSO28]|uniref:phenylacetate--CoA ligase family protein n=1 Tax=Haloarchaeobius sp. TZWSO28 TaxID=3446119 RepID=UPI003EBF746C
MSHMHPGESVCIRLDALGATHASRRRIERRQRRQLEDHLSFVARNSRFYKQLYGDPTPSYDTFRKLPPVTKSQLMEHFDDVVTDPAVTRAEVDAFIADPTKVGHRLLGCYPVWTTTGTTGEPGIFLQDDRAMTVADAVSDRWTYPPLLDLRSATRLARHDLRIAEFAIGRAHYAAASGTALMRREHRFFQRRLRLFSPKRPLTEVVTELNEFQPAILFGYSTVLEELARERRAGQLKVSPALVLPSGEPITAAGKRELRRVFSCPVRELYGATEFTGIAGECGHGNLHANTDWLVLEPVDEDYQPVPPGDPSATVLLTNLANRIQPLVRYDLGDSVTMHDEPCPCGSPFPILTVEGRQGDVLRFEAEAGAQVPIFPLAISSIVEEVDGVYRTQLCQTGPQSLRVRLEVAEDADEPAVRAQVEEALASFLRGQGLTGVDIEQAAEPPARDPGGKFRHVWSETD